MEQYWAPIAYVLSAYILLDKAVCLIKSRLHPATSLPAKIRTLEKGYADYLVEHARTLDLCEEIKKANNEQFEEFEKINKLQCKAMLDIMRHMRDGNHVDNMNKTIREIEDILIDI